LSIKNFFLSNNLTFVISLAVIVILPVHVHYLPPFMILWGLAWLFENNFKIKKYMFLNNKAAILFLLFMLLFMWQISGLLLADSFSAGFERIFKRLSFLLFPLVLFFPGGKIIRNVNLLVRLFAIASFVYIIYCFGNALNNSLIIQGGKWVFNCHPEDIPYENFFYGYRLASTMHPSYLTLYIIFSVLISLETLFNNILPRYKKVFWLTLVLIFFIAIYLLSARAGILASLIIFPAYFLLKFYNKFSKWIIITSIIILAVLFIGIAKTNYRIDYTFKKITKDNIDETIEKNVRIIVWKSAFGVIKDNLLLGVGTGDASAELKKEFISQGYVDGFYDDLNAHNQYIEILLENGLIGLIVFFTIVGYMIFISVSERNLLYGMYILLMLIFFFFETILNRLSGVSFFSLFSFLLIYYKENEISAIDSKID
jgi:O-antigen ligase